MARPHHRTSHGVASKARLKTAADALRGQREELSEGRRVSVYKTDSELFQPDLRAGTSVPLRGTESRRRWDAAIVADLESGMTYMQVAEKYKTSQATIWRVVADARAAAAVKDGDGDGDGEERA